MRTAPPRNNVTQQQPNQSPLLDDVDMQTLSEMEDEDLRAAIAASLMDTSPAMASVEANTPQNENRNSEDNAA